MAEIARIRRLTGTRLDPMKQWGTAPSEPSRAKRKAHCHCPPERPCGCGPNAGRRSLTGARSGDSDDDDDGRSESEAGGFEATLAELRQRARQRAALYALGGGLVGLIPLPVSDGPLLLTLESRLAGDIARLYDPETSRRQIARLTPVIGSAAVALRGAAKLVRKRAGRWGAVTDGLIAFGGMMLIGEGVAWWTERKMRE